MKNKTINIIGWVLTGLIILMYVGSAYGKLVGNEQTLNMFAEWGIDSGTLKIIALIELSSVILFALPRTGILGTLLLVAYMGGAIATHVEHNVTIWPPVIISCIVWITAILRFPELKVRLRSGEFQKNNQL